MNAAQPTSLTAEAIEGLLPGRRVEEVLPLRSSSRTTVARVHLAPVRGEVDHVVAKRFLAPDGYAKEAAALACLPPGLPVPTLLAEDRSERLLVMSDVGGGPSVADALLGPDREAAEAALGAWAEALAAVHRATVTSRARFAAAIEERAATPVTVDPTPGWLAGLPEALRASAAELGLVLSGDITGELDAVAGALSDTGLETLSPGDTCPDNNVSVGGRLALVDFEEAAFRHVAWDLAYLRVPWPSCWCAWGIPESVGTEALRRYLDGSGGDVAWPDHATLERGVDLATLGWGLISGSWFLPRGLTRDDTMGPPGWAAPRRRATVVQRFRVAEAAAGRLGYESLGRAARTWKDALERRWGPQALPLAPAFR
jgi:hypothetical protein